MVEPKGPVFEGNIEEFAVMDGGRSYRVCYLPDRNNPDLQREGKSPHFYWLPAEVRIAQNAQGRYKFSMAKFQGELSEDTHSGVEGEESVAGGILSVTTTSKPPEGVLQRAHEQLREKFRGDDDRYWGIRSDRAPQFGIVPIASNQTSISNVSPNADGSVSAIEGEGAERSAADDSRTTDDESIGAGDDAAVNTDVRSGPRADPRVGGDSSEAVDQPQAPSDRTGGATSGSSDGSSAGGTAGPQRSAITGPPVPSRSLIDPSESDGGTSRGDTRSGPDMWYERMDGGGPGSIDPAGENAFVGRLGMIPAAILWDGFRQEYSPVAVTQWMKLRVWSESVHLKIEGNWERIHNQFSAHAQGRRLWAAADIKFELDRLITNGDITVELSVDGTTPSGPDHAEAVQKRIDLVVTKFTDQAKDIIFRPPTKAEAADAGDAPSSIFSLFSPKNFRLALRSSNEIARVNLSYEETINERYLLDHVISSSLRGFYDDIKDDPDAERRYFRTINLDSEFRVVQRVARPVANWGDRARGVAGDPIEFMSVQIGYPDTQGNLMWRGQVFDDGNLEPARLRFSRKGKDEVADPPEDWEPDRVMVKRRVHFKEPPGPSDYPYTTVQIEKEIAEIDPGEYGTPSDDLALEVRADNAGQLLVGPMFLNVELENSRQYVEVAFKPDGTTEGRGERGWTRMAWNYDGQNEPRIWNLFTGDPDYVPSFRYQVRVVVRGTIFSAGAEWLGPEQTVSGNGPLSIRVPTPDEAIGSRSLTPRETAGLDPVRSLLDDEVDDGTEPIEIEVVDTTATMGTESEDMRPPSERATLSEHVDAGGGSTSEYGTDDSGQRERARERSGGGIVFDELAGWTME
ncbi:hypothetical protein [Natronorarus salvus]|uniref:hypothetical protein n=1 Tax=Natronorarus salvus TaxID=3117733 RepID=UPI002F2698D5